MLDYHNSKYIHNVNKSFDLISTLFFFRKVEYIRKHK